MPPDPDPPPAAEPDVGAALTGLHDGLERAREIVDEARLTILQLCEDEPARAALPAASETEDEQQGDADQDQADGNQPCLDFIPHER